MQDRIIKGGRSVEGDEFVVSICRTGTPPPEEADAQPAPEVDAAAGEQQLSAQALDAAERIRSEAEQMASEIAQQARAAAERQRAQTEDELAELMETTLRELETQRENIERETRTKLEQEYRDRYRQAVAALEAAAAGLGTHRDAYLAEIEQPAFNLVLAIARQLLGAELTRSPRFIAEMIKEAYKLLRPENVVQVALHPATFHLLSEDALLTGVLREAGIAVDRVELTIDETLKPAAFTARLGGVCVDYDLDTAIAELAEHLAQRAATEWDADER